MDFDANKIKEYKIEVFVPIEAETIVLDAIRSVKVGIVGNYYNCISCTKVFSSWDANDKATPFLGKKGERYQTEEIKIETRCSKERLKDLVEKIKEVHPYESVCINALPLIDI